MEPAQHLAAVRTELAALDAAVRAGRVDAPVPTCPGWTVVDLVAHVTRFADFWTYVLRHGERPPGVDRPRDHSVAGRPVAEGEPLEREGDPDGGDGADPTPWADWLAGRGAALVEALESTPPDAGVWTWMEDRTAAVVARRCAHELAIHRVDAELARGPASPVAADLAADGIEEIFVLVASRPPSGTATRSGQTLHLHGTDRPDAGDEWLVVIGADGLEVRREHAKGDLAVRGSVADLELVLYDRPPNGEVQRFGDETVLETWRAAFTF